MIFSGILSEEACHDTAGIKSEENTFTTFGL